MNRAWSASLVVTLLTLAATPALATEMAFTGTARTDGGEMLYLERHRVSGSCQSGVFRPEEHTVGYFRANESAPFASKRLAYPESTIRPVVDFRQPGFDESLSIQYPAPNTLAVNWQMPQGETRGFDVSYPEDLVVDAGFDNFVRRHWRAVIEGKPVEFRFLAPTRGEHFGFVLERADRDRVNARHVVQIRPTGFVLRFLVDPIILGYDENGALTDYYGLTNIRKDMDTNFTAHIRYAIENWPDCELTP